MPQNENEYHDDENGEAEDEDDEDITLKENDHVLLAGIDSPDGTANIEVRFWLSELKLLWYDSRRINDWYTSREKIVQIDKSR